MYLTKSTQPNRKWLEEDKSFKFLCDQHFSMQVVNGVFVNEYEPTEELLLYKKKKKNK